MSEPKNDVIGQIPSAGVVYFDMTELTLILIEACQQMQAERKDGQTAADIITAMHIPENVGKGFERMGHAAVDYFMRCMQAGGIQTHDKPVGGMQ
jgi:hypothetical protein